MSCVDFSNVTKNQTAVWLALKAHILKNSGTEQLYICKYCQPFLNKNTMPARCVLNGLFTEPVPDELKSLDALSKQLIQRAKAFQCTHNYLFFFRFCCNILLPLKLASSVLCARTFRNAALSIIA